MKGIFSPTRRDAIALAATAGASWLVAGASPGEAAKAPEAAGATRRPVINALGSLDDPNLWGTPRSDEVSDRVIADALASGMTAINITLGHVAGDAEPFETTVRDIARWNAIVAARPDALLQVRSAADIEHAAARGQLGLIYGFQNGTMLGDSVDRVDLFDDLGVRIFQLTYNPQNRLGGGAIAARDTKLSPFGREVVARLNARRLIVDLSHSGYQTCIDAANASTMPIAITHTGCQALSNVPRNKTDEELRLIAGKGGFVGIYFMPFLADGRQITSADVVAHIEHAINICGEDVVGIGTDGPTTAIDDMPRWAAAFARDIERRRAAGVSAPGERPDSFLFAIDMTGPDQFRILAEKLRMRGHSQARIDKILGGNFLRYARDIWGR